MVAPMAAKGMLRLFVRSGGKEPARVAKSLKKKGVKLPRKLRKPVLLIALQVLQAASAQCPVQTGALRASGRLEPAMGMSPGKMGYTVVFGGAGTGVNYARAVEYTKKPFLRPAVAKVKKSAGVRGVLVKVVNDTWKGS